MMSGSFVFGGLRRRQEGESGDCRLPTNRAVRTHGAGVGRFEVHGFDELPIVSIQTVDLQHGVARAQTGENSPDLILAEAHPHLKAEMTC